ncbi:MAG: DNA polymerase III subunit delta [Lachnospiraceae bacterium]|nr:DNA polymerase III subunit delta [Lachnospiraceae bacterium]
MLNVKKDIENNTLKNCYLLYGSEDYLIKTYEERIRVAATGNKEDMMNIAVFDDRKLTSGPVIDSAETLPFLAEKRVVVVRDSGFFKTGKKDDTEAIAKYISDVPESTVIVFCENDIDKRNAAYKAVSKHGYAAEFKPLAEKDMIKWIAKEFKNRKITVDAKTSAFLIRVTGADMTAIVTEIEKLSSFGADKGSIDINDINDVCVVTPELKIFEMVGAMGSKNTEKAIGIYRNMILYNESPFGILAMITRHFRLMYQCAELIDMGENFASVAAKLGLRDFAVRDYCRQAKNFSREKLKKAVEDCLKADVDVKSGKIKDVLAVELLLIEYSI